LLASESPRRQEFRNFLRAKPNAADYAEFRAACEQTGTSWRHWEERMRHGKLQSGDYSERARNYHLYAQWVAEEQITALAQRCQQKGVHFYLDLPNGVHLDGYDVWRQMDLFAVRAAAGAPPDVFFSLGQNWGFPPLHPERLRRRGYCYFIDFVRLHMQHTGLLRLDHILGLHRVYWIPPGAPPTLGAYVSYPADEFQAILSLESHRVAIEEAGAKISWSQLPLVHGDRVQLTQLFQNLIGNAIKFRRAGSPSIEISAERHENEWHIRVRDNGIGIDPKYFDRIFVLFQQLHTRQEYAGTGMGLAICKKIVERHGGRIWVESQPGQGSTFWFTLPEPK
jgi:anti-sigma regulatory factor (Ser/Thr protein kinase)